MKKSNISELLLLKFEALTFININLIQKNAEISQNSPNLLWSQRDVSLWLTDAMLVYDWTILRDAEGWAYTYTSNNQLRTYL